MTAPLEAAARRDLYALTARLFAAEVDVALYRALAVQEALGLIDAELYAMGEERALEALAVEFCRLFIGPQPPCVPYASAHRGEALLDTATAVHEFLCDHVLPWVPAYCEQVAAATALGFYRTTARLVAALLAEEEPSGNASIRPE